MKYLLPCHCGQSVEIRPDQAGQTVICVCGASLLVPSMIQVKALPVVPEKPNSTIVRKRFPYTWVLVMLSACLVCFCFFFYLRRVDYVLSGIALGCTCSFFVAAIAMFCREWIIKPNEQTNMLSRTFFVIGILLLYPAFILSLYLYAWTPDPRHATIKPKEFTFGSQRTVLYQDSTPIDQQEIRILWMTDEEIDFMMPMELYFYYQTLKEPMFSYNFQENHNAVWATWYIWIGVNGVLYFLVLLSIVGSFFMPRETIEISGWSGSEWQ